MARFVALLRAVNVGGRKLPMGALRQLCEELAWSDVATYIQSGNVVFAADAAPETLEAALERAIAERFGLDVPVMVRRAGEWAALAGGNPFAQAARDEPNRLLLLVTKKSPAADAAERLAERAQGGEKVRLVGEGLWIHFAEGVARSKLTPAAIAKACGSPATGRNFRTVLKLGEMLAQ